MGRLGMPIMLLILWVSSMSFVSEVYVFYLSSLKTIFLTVSILLGPVKALSCHIEELQTSLVRLRNCS